MHSILYTFFYLINFLKNYTTVPDNFDLYRPFEPPIGKFKIPLKTVNKIIFIQI